MLSTFFPVLFNGIDIIKITKQAFKIELKETEQISLILIKTRSVALRSKMPSYCVPSDNVRQTWFGYHQQYSILLYHICSLSIVYYFIIIYHFKCIVLIIIRSTCTLCNRQRDQWYRRYKIHKDSIKF